MSIRLKSGEYRRRYLREYSEAKRAGMWSGDFRKLSKREQKEVWAWCVHRYLAKQEKPITETTPTPIAGEMTVR